MFAVQIDENFISNLQVDSENNAIRCLDFGMGMMVSTIAGSPGATG